MKNRLFLLIVLCLASTWIGCKQSDPAAPGAPKKESAQSAAPATDVASTAFTLVTLKVPNMT